MAHAEELYAYALRLTRASIPEAEDLVQATYERAFSRWRQLRDPGALRAWLFQILRGIFFNERRRAKHSPILELVVTGREPDGPAPEPLPDELVERMHPGEIEAALGALPEPQREVVMLADLWGFSYSEIAEIVECPVGTVRSRLNRARAALAGELEGLARSLGYLKGRDGASRWPGETE